MKPLIGLTGNHSDIDVTLRDAYHKQIVEAGGVPVIIPPVDDEQVIREGAARVIAECVPDAEITARYEKKYQAFRSLYPALRGIFPTL